MDSNEFDLEMMKMALRLAERASELGEVPVGAVLVKGADVIGWGHNEVEMRKDATAHAELLALREGALRVGDWRLIGTTLYSTLEPCMMCAGALFLSRVDRVVYGARDFRHGAHGSLIDLFSLKHPTHALSIEGGLLEASSAMLLKEFFKKQRK